MSLHLQILTLRESIKFWWGMASESRYPDVIRLAESNALMRSRQLAEIDG